MVDFEDESGVGRLIEEKDNNVDIRSLTVQDLINIFGEEAVRRGLQYTASLSEAEQEFISSIEDDDYEKGLEKAGVDDVPQNVSEQWKKQTQSGGLKLDDDE